MTQSQPPQVSDVKHDKEMIWHILPINDLKEHSEESTCECNPIIKQMLNGDLMCVHNAYDGRETAEQLLEETDREKQNNWIVRCGTILKNELL